MPGFRPYYNLLTKEFTASAKPISMTADLVAQPANQSDHIYTFFICFFLMCIYPSYKFTKWLAISEMRKFMQSIVRKKKPSQCYSKKGVRIIIGDKGDKTATLALYQIIDFASGSVQLVLQQQFALLLLSNAKPRKQILFRWLEENVLVGKLCFAQRSSSLRYYIKNVILFRLDFAAECRTQMLVNTTVHFLSTISYCCTR